MKIAQDYYEQERIKGNTSNITTNPNPSYPLEFYQEIFKLMEGFASQHPTLSKESVMEILKNYSPIVRDLPHVDDKYYRTLSSIHFSNVAKDISNLTPAVSDDKLLELLLSENGLEDERIAKLFKDSMDAAYKAILEALHEAWGEIKQFKATKPAVSDEHNYLRSPGFEHLPNDAQELGTSTDHTISKQPDVSEDIKMILYNKFMEVLPVTKISKFRKVLSEGYADDVIESIQSIQPAKGEECECKDLNATNRICNHCGKIVPIIHYQNPPTPDEKGGEG